MPALSPHAPSITPAEWTRALAPFQRPSNARALLQVLTSHGAYLLTWVLMIYAWSIAWWLALPLAVLAGGLLIRIFIIFHDCGHGSFSTSRRANAVLGFISGVLTFTPYRHWNNEHERHHRSSGDLDRRGVGDIWTLTVAEYRASSPLRRLLYRLSRHPLVLFGLAPLPIFVGYQRLTTRGATQRERKAVWATNFTILALCAGMIWLVGWLPFLVLQGTATMISGATGLWLFYVQHQYEGVYWSRNAEWNYTRAALEGCSFYKLPRVLQWFTGNIGFHHVHHLNPRIPNYRLEACHNANAFLREVPTLSLRASLRSASLALWDEASERLVSFREARVLPA
jgi:omega-6 fatty acid desaturase (delta-12 desaturase)